MKLIGITGTKTRLGSLLLERPNFVPFNTSITNITAHDQEWDKLDLIVNCEEYVPDDWGEEYKKAIEANVRGLYNLHRYFGNRVLTISTTEVTKNQKTFSPYTFSKFGAEAVSQINGGKIVRIPPYTGWGYFSLEDYDCFADQIEKFALNYNNIPRVVKCKAKGFWGWLS